jgi:hypothetical protein
VLAIIATFRAVALAHAQTYVAVSGTGRFFFFGISTHDPEKHETSGKIMRMPRDRTPLAELQGNAARPPTRRQRILPPAAGCGLPPGVAFLPKPWQPFNVLVVAEEALAYAQGNRS